MQLKIARKEELVCSSSFVVINDVSLQALILNSPLSSCAAKVVACRAFPLPGTGQDGLSATCRGRSTGAAFYVVDEDVHVRLNLGMIHELSLTEKKSLDIATV